MPCTWPAAFSTSYLISQFWSSRCRVYGICRYLWRRRSIWQQYSRPGFCECFPSFSKIYGLMLQISVHSQSFFETSSLLTLCNLGPAWRLSYVRTTPSGLYNCPISATTWQSWVFGLRPSLPLAQSSAVFLSYLDSFNTSVQKSAVYSPSRRNPKISPRPS